MTSEIRANTLKNRVGLGTVSFTNTGIVVSGIVTANSFSGSLTSNGDITGTGDLTLTSTDAGSSAAPIINLFRNSASPADADYLGQIKFQGESDTGVQRNYAKITGKILDASNGTEDGIIEFAHIKAGSQNISARFRSDSLQLLNDTNLSVAGDTTLTGDIDVDGHTNLDNVSIAGVTTMGNGGTAVNIVGDLSISHNIPKISLIDTDNNSDYEIKNQNGVLAFRDLTNSVTRFQIASDGKVLMDNTTGTFTIGGDNVYDSAKINLMVGSMSQTSATTEATALVIHDQNSRRNGTEGSGSWKSKITFRSTQINGNSASEGASIVHDITYNNYSSTKMRSDLVFKTRGDAQTSTSDAATEKLRIRHDGKVIIGSSSVSPATSFTDNLVVSEATANAGIQIVGNNSNSNFATLGLGDAGGNLRSYLEAQLGANGNFTIGTGGSGPIRFVNSGGERFKIDGNGNISHNSSGGGISYFKGSSEYIFGSQYSSPSSGGPEAGFQVHANKSRATVSINGYYNNAGAPILQFVSSRSNTTGVLGTKAVNGDYIGDIRFFGDNGTNGSTLVQSAAIHAFQRSNISDGDTVAAGEISFLTGTATGGSVTEKLKITSSGTIQFKGDANPQAEFDRGSANNTNINLKYNGTFTGQVSAANGDFQLSAVGGSTPITFYADGGEKVRIGWNGDNAFLRIADNNTSSPGSHGFRFGSYAIQMRDTGGYNHWYIRRNYGGWQTQPQVTLKANGYTGVGRLDPTHTLDVDGTSIFRDRIFFGSGSMKSVPFGANVTYDTGISINGYGYGGSILALCSRNYGAGTSTQAGLYYLEFKYDGNHIPTIHHVSGDTFVTFGKSASNTLTVNMGASNNVITMFESSVVNS